MNTLTRISVICLMAFVLLVPNPAHAQLNTVLQTSLSAAITATQKSFAVASATGINGPNYNSGTAGSSLYIVDVGQEAGELVSVVSVSGTTITVSRTGPGGAYPHASGAMVLVATAANWFYMVDPRGTCTLASTYVTPWVNITNGNQWLCSTKTGTWTASWGNNSGTPAALTATATASVAGATAIAGPFIEISGTNAITSFTMGTGWQAQSFCAYPTGAFTGTATNNISKAFTAVADRVLCFVYNANTAKFSPQY